LPLQLGGYALYILPPQALAALTETGAFIVHLICKSGEAVVPTELAEGSMLKVSGPGD
jgi:hypothetical protein